MGARLRLDSVTKVYGDVGARVLAVDDVSLDIAPGEIVLVMGPSGSGKTTLLAMCGALLRPTSGRISIDNLDITTVARRRLAGVRATSVGFVFQMFNLLESLTVLENVRIVMAVAGVSRKQSDRRAREILHSLDM